MKRRNTVQKKKNKNRMGRLWSYTLFLYIVVHFTQTQSSIVDTSLSVLTIILSFFGNGFSTFFTSGSKGVQNNTIETLYSPPITKFHDESSLKDYFRDENFKDRNTGPNKKELGDALGNLPKNGELFEQDIVMDSRLREAIQGVSKKSVLIDSYKWPNGILYYEVEPDFQAKELLEKTIEEFERRTCIRFQRRTNEKDYVIYTSKENVCSSYIGRFGGPQKIHIGKDCKVLGTVEHETMHALGFIHEHSRPDRDQYLDVKWDNIKKKEWLNFNKYKFSDVNNENVEYNFASVMHYRNDAFTKNGHDTLMALIEPTLKFGQRVKFSVGDIESINKLYNCTKKLKSPDYDGLYKDYTLPAKDTILVRKLREMLLKKRYDWGNI